MIGQNMRPMPPDFERHAHEGMGKLMKRYHAGAEPVRRWKELCGTLRPWGRSVIRIDEQGNEKRYVSVRAAAMEVFACDASNIYHALREGGTAYGYSWRYVEE